MKKLVYIIFFSTLLLNAQQVDSLELEQKLIKEDTSIVTSRDSIIKDEVNANQIKVTKTEIKSLSNKEGIWGIAIAIMVGLIPIMLQIWYSLKEYKKSQIDKYGSSLYEKQYPIYFNLFEKLVELQKRITDVAVARLLNKDFTSTENSRIEYYPIRNYSKTLIELDNYIDKNLVLIPNALVNLLYEYSENSYLVKYTYDKETQLANYPEIEIVEKPIIKDLKELEEFYNKNEQLFGDLLVYIKTLIGTEDLSKKTIKYLNESKKWNNLKLRNSRPVFDKSKWR